MTPKLTRFVASGFGCGLAPYAPGTLGTLAAIPFAMIWANWPFWVSAPIILLMLPIGAFICNEGAKLDGSKDPGWIVFDEMVGYWVATAFLAPTFTGFLAAFFLFRLFDIIKLPPVGWIDDNVKGGWGILLDDVAAGLMARIVLVGLAYLGLI